MGERIVFSTNGAEQMDIHVQKNEVGPLPHTMYKNQLKIDQRPMYKIQNYRNFRRKRR